MTVIASLDFDDLTAGDPIAGSSPWVVEGASFTADAGAAHGGALGARMADTSSYGYLAYNPSTAPSSVYVSAWLNVRTMVDKLAPMLAVTASSTNIADWRIRTGGTVQIRQNFTAVATSTGTVSAATWVRADWHIDLDAGTQELRIYGEDGTQLVDVSGAASASGETTVPYTGVGSTASVSGGALDMDTLQILDDWPDPPGGSGSTGPSWWLKTATGAIPMVTTIAS